MLNFFTQNILAVTLLLVVALIVLLIRVEKIELKLYGAYVTFIIIVLTLSAVLLLMQESSLRNILTKVFVITVSLVFWFVLFKWLKKKW